ncbi:hypothetical protein DFH06DRAFT_1110759 [Mycena polygramma]|nr:hypothetical protein DFH06DRAFT_1110759 [Mycena polygramma]
MQKGEDRNFLRFAAALKILVGSSISVTGLDRAKGLLQDYLLEFSKLYGRSEMKPNHHWAVHVPDQALDYGPLYGIWAFLTERLNKVLKNFNSNNWSGGLLEVSMMREFHRMAQLEGMTSGPNVPFELRWENEFIRLLFDTGENREALGTVQDAATHGRILYFLLKASLTYLSERTLSRVSPGDMVEKAFKIDDDAMRLALVEYYNRNDVKVHLPNAPQRAPNSKMLDSFAESYNYALLDGRRLTSTKYSRRGPGSCLIQIHFKGEIYAGEIRHLFCHTQQGISESGRTLMAFIVWMVPSTDTPLDDDSFIWHDFPEFGAETWIYKQYAKPNDANFPPQVLPLDEVQCQVSRETISYTEPPLWITTTMDRV